ncbi:DsbA family oxidoreductase [Candidimonas nitroreducens]|uniref:Disulfide bond formation protein DsbA n=1 Tax=Candidimonas nitroreducens TaxID=683354 RepID=A0A225N1C0_9BURK|nr:DsbA family oxidoreductase [Candidimonas nitroreducens]OWT65880.1 disulfide bond formation protein DsbA [Candidimonas nitroreducens]
MAGKLKIDFVSDVSCPWCAIGLSSLEQALAQLDGEVGVDLHFQPFELNPQMPAEGRDFVEYLGQKYGRTPQEVARSAENIRQRGAQVGFEFAPRTRVYNTFDAHRLLHWAGLQGRQRELKHALFRAYFTEGRSPGDIDVLADLAAQVGLDAAQAREILASDAYAQEVREREGYYRDAGIDSVPSIIVNDKHLIQGGQPPEVFEQALRRIASAPQ